MGRFPSGCPTHPPSPSVPLDAATRKAGSSAVCRGGEFRGAGATPRNRPRPSGRKLIRVGRRPCGRRAVGRCLYLLLQGSRPCGDKVSGNCDFPARRAALGIAGQGNHGGLPLRTCTPVCGPNGHRPKICPAQPAAGTKRDSHKATKPQRIALHQSALTSMSLWLCVRCNSFYSMDLHDGPEIIWKELPVVTR